MGTVKPTSMATTSSLGKSLVYKEPPTNDKHNAKLVEIDASHTNYTVNARIVLEFARCEVEVEYAENQLSS